MANRLTIESLQKELKDSTGLHFKVLRVSHKEPLPPFQVPSYELVMINSKTERFYRGRKPTTLEGAKQICSDPSKRHLFTTETEFESAIDRANKAFESFLVEIYEKR
jgi:hypothetical protein